MIVKENQVFRAAIQLVKNVQAPIPEAVIYGYAKLLMMNEAQVRAFVPEECMEDVDLAHKWFADNNLDVELVKNGLAMVMCYIPKNKTEESYEKFFEFLNSDVLMIRSKGILDKALEVAYLPITKMFADGNDLRDLLSFQEQLKEEYDRCTASDSDDSDDSDDSEEDEIVADSFVKKSSGRKATISRRDSDDEDAQTLDSFVKDGKDDEEEPEEIELRNLSELSKKYRDLSLALLDVVEGQDQAVMKFVQGYNQGELLKQTEKGGHPKTYFFFFGPPGVGKTLLATTAAENLGIPHKIFNMSEYAAHQAHEELIGISKIYSGAKEGSLVKFVRENPECLLIFDEIEKAHINVIRQFLQILGSGTLHNVYRDDDTSFRDTTIIFTSNVGKDLYADRSVNLTSLPEKVIVDAIQSEKNLMGEPALPPEICSRIASGNTVMFNHLSIQHLAKMVRKNFDKIVAGMEAEYNVHITYAKELPLLFLYNRGGEIDARVALGQSGKFMKNEIYELMRQLESRNIGDSIRNIHIDIEWTGMEAELKRLFKNEDKSEVLVFSDNEDLFASIDADKYVIHRVTALDEAMEIVKNDIAAVYIDPFFGTGKNDETVLSISDYNTEGVRLFHNLAEKNVGLPVYLLEMDRNFSEVDRDTFLQEGAFGTIPVSSSQIESFKRQFSQTMEELYMEKESLTFSQRGWIIDFSTKQGVSEDGVSVNIVFYDLKKRKAVDVESRGSILSDAERPNIHFSDVIGAGNAKEELQFFVNYLKNPKKFLMTGGKVPSGVLLYGPPGTGKTMLAKAMAGECDVNFLQTSAAEFKSHLHGDSEENIRKLFAKAKRYAPSIIFIDEIDAIGKKRTGNSAKHIEESMLNTLLTEMQGFSSGDVSKPVFVLAATNFGVGSEYEGISSLDEALIRRFDNKVYVDLPNQDERKEYILMMKNKKNLTGLSDKVAESIAERTTGQSLAILQNVIELAQRNAIKENREVSDDDLLTALEEYIYGEKKEHTPEYYQKVAIHESGHAYVSYISGDKPSYITIESRGNFGGYMQHANQEDIPEYSKEDLLAKIRCALGGRAAEKVFYGDEKSLNTGASSDLAHATDLAWRIICTYGMEDQLMVLRKDEILASPMAADYVAKVNEMLNREMKNTVEIIENAKEKIRSIADTLVKENRLTGAQFEELMEQK